MDQLEQLGLAAVICCFWMDLDGAGQYKYYYIRTMGFITDGQGGFLEPARPYSCRAWLDEMPVFVFWDSLLEAVASVPPLCDVLSLVDVSLCTRRQVFRRPGCGGKGVIQPPS